MRVFELDGHDGSVWRVTFENEDDIKMPICVSEGPSVLSPGRAIGGSWSLRGVLESKWRWREVVPVTEPVCPDIANATIAELQARVAELESELDVIRNEAKCILHRTGVVLKVPSDDELPTLLDLKGILASDHEAADARAEVQA